MNRLSRITAILIQLQSKRIITAKEIAQRFEISLRTVYRDIKTLQEAGVPIGAENGVGYYLLRGYTLPPVAITEEEANALIISERFIKKQGDKSLTKNFDSLLFKIKSIVKNYQKDNIALLEKRTDTVLKGKVYESNWLSEIQKAIANAFVLAITYHSANKDEITNRNIEPLAIYFTNNAWIVIAHCRLRNSLREFRLDRIQQLIVTSDTFELHSEFNIQNYFESFRT